MSEISFAARVCAGDGARGSQTVSPLSGSLTQYVTTPSNAMALLKPSVCSRTRRREERSDDDW